MKFDLKLTNKILMLFLTGKLNEHGCEIRNILEMEEVIHTKGSFSVKHTNINMYPENTLGCYNWKASHNPIMVYFYKNDKLLFTKEFIRHPGIVIHGDGINEEKTFFTFCETRHLAIFDMNNKFIRCPDIGADFFTEFKRVNEKYAIGISQEGCTCDPFTGLFNLDIFFGLIECSEIRPYENSRVHVPIYKEDLLVTPLIANENGFEVKINKIGIYSWIVNGTVSYDDVFEGIADFYDYNFYEIKEIKEDSEEDAEEEDNFYDKDEKAAFIDNIAPNIFMKGNRILYLKKEDHGEKCDVVPIMTMTESENILVNNRVICSKEEDRGEKWNIGPVMHFTGSYTF